MYPTTHDILPEIMNESFRAIRNMLKANINVLAVSKPHFKVVKNLVRSFPNYKSGQPKITLRFTISTNKDELMFFWELETPRFKERLNHFMYLIR